ncbi:hypothetical protein FSHL1_009717 [Fusarium sambucinum]
MSSKIETDILIVGAGPSGAALAAFLGQNGLSGLVIAKDATTAQTPRAHGFNAFAFECLRDIGLEDEALRLAMRGPSFCSMRFSRNLVGEEYGRIAAWEEDPIVSGLRKSLTPCEFVDLTQRHTEPLILRAATHSGFNVRFSYEMLDIKSFTDDQNKKSYICQVLDHLTNHTVEIKTKYLFGADGGRSQVARTFDFEFDSKRGGPKAVNILIETDLSPYLNEERYSGLHWMVQPDRKVFPGVVAHLRAVRPWNEWVVVAIAPPGTNPFENLTPDHPEIIELVRELVGDKSLAAKVVKVDHWSVRESVAKTYSSGPQLHLIGDAAHRHPPALGLGANTCIQDSYNLAWKVAFVERGLAGPRLLETYTVERQPVGESLVRESNNQLRVNLDVQSLLGMSATSPEEGLKRLHELSQPTPEGGARRDKLMELLELKRVELESLGIAYNQWYTSEAVYLEDEPALRPQLEGNPVTEVQISTYPGSRLPHAWIDTPNRQKRISTHDLAGKGAFCLLIGGGGGNWRVAAEKIHETTNIPINVYSIGHGQQFNDFYRDWYKRRGVGDAGCVLVRPDRFVAWRSVDVAENCERKLGEVLDKILLRHEL